MAATKIWLNGGTGRMGQTIRRLLRDANDLRLLGFSNKVGHYDADDKELAGDDGKNHIAEAEIIIDFSTPNANAALLKNLQGKPNKAILISTTGLTESLINEWKVAAEKHENWRILFARNTSLAVLATRQLTEMVANFLLSQNYDCEIVETHHRGKIDAPSGTALMLGEAVIKNNPTFALTSPSPGKRQSDKINIHAIRGGGVAGEHSVRFLGEHDEISITHRAFNRDLFGSGALALARWLSRQNNGVYHAEEIDFKTI